MNKELNIGDYVRWCNGDIARITDIKKYKTKEDEYYFDRVLDWHEDRAENNNIVYEGLLDLKDFKSSPNIIDLIKENDYVNGSKVIFVDKELKCVIVSNSVSERGLFYEKDIKSIVTREMFESMEYKIGE
jgi:hypothetical protein